VKLLIAACALVLASSVLAGCGGLSAKQRLARREAVQLFPHVGLAASGRPKITSIDIRGGNWADVIVQGHFTAPNTGCLSGSCAPSIAKRVRLGFALRDPQQHWNMSYDFGHGF
jgi:hypothetical protein